MTCNPMKIAYVYDRIYPYLKGGAEKRILEISEQLAERGHEVHLFGMKFWDGEDVFIKNGVFLHGVCEPMEMYVNGRRSIKEAIYFAYKVLSPMMKEDFDVINVSEFPYFSCFSAKIVSSLKRTPLVIIWHEVWDSYWYEYLGKYKGFIGRTIERLTIRLPDKVLAISNMVRKDLIDIGVDARKIDVIYRGVNIKTHEIEEGSDIIYVGRLNEHKNVDYIVRAINLITKEIPDVRCFIIGDGPEREKLEKEVKKLNLHANIKFLGLLNTSDEVFAYLKSSKVFLFPSTREGFGSVIIEANACGLPVIGIKHENNASEELITHGKNGFLVELSEKDVYEKTIKLLKNENLRKEMSKYCLESVKKYDWDKIINEIERVYRELLNNRQNKE